MKIRLSRSREQGVALVTTVIVVAMLAVVGVAFMQSTSTDRLSSRSVANNFRARLAAEAGAASAEALVADLVKRYPDSATVWQDIGGASPDGTNNEATVLYVRAQAADPTTGARPGQSGGEVTLLARPLVSLTGSDDPVPLGDLASMLPSGGPDTVNLNATNSSRPDPFVGRRSSVKPGTPVTAAQWIDLTNATGEVTARFAYWIEDESFKVNVNVATNGRRGADSLGLSPAEARLDGSWGSSENSSLRSANAAEVVGARGVEGFPTALTAVFPAGITDQEAAEELKFLTTAHSAAHDVSRGGFKRFNVNSVITGDKREALNRITAAITNPNAAPTFGERFYRTGTPTPQHQAIYLQKLAANIYDYIDDDDQPTIVNNDGGFTLRTGKPAYGIEASGGGLDGPNSVAAMGIENVPRLQEYAIHGRVRKMRYDPSNPDSFGFNSTNTTPAPQSAEYEIWLDHYFELWNPGTRDYTFPAGSFLKIYDQPAFGRSITGDLGKERESSDIPLAGVTVRAGRTVVLTTAQPGEISAAANASTNGFALIDTTRLTSPADIISVQAPDADRKFKGTTRDIKNAPYESRGVGPTFPYNRLFEVNMKPRSTRYTDYQSAVVLGNGQGIIESFVGLPFAWSQTVNAFELCVSNGYIRDGMEGVGTLGSGNNDYVRGGYLAGNTFSNSSPLSTEGDPRALNEQLSFLNYVSGGFGSNPDQTRLSVAINGSSPLLPSGSTIGRANTNYVRADRWVDYSSTASGDTNAPLFVRNAPLQTIGELGHVTDPARVAGPGGISLSRGGGRTLRIGQPEHATWFDRNQTGASRTRTSWRLADILSTKTNVTIQGMINPNGALRDNGAALRAALFDLQFQPVAGGLGATGLAGASANAANVVAAVTARLTNTAGTGIASSAVNPFWERGEISELSLFSTGNTLASGINMSNVFDRGREELVRRSIEMLTPRGSVFSAYVVGQALQVVGGRTNVLSSVRLKTTFALEPEFPAGATDDTFSPGNFSGRFQPPTGYEVKVLSTFYD